MNDIEKGQLSSCAVQCFSRADGSLSRFPQILKRVITERVWERRSHNGRVIELKNLRELITEKPIHGWGQDPKKIEALLKDDPEVLPMWRGAMSNGKGKPVNNDNIINKDSQGTSRSYTLSRLEKQHPEIYQEVCAGQLSANAAAIKAGFRKKLTPFEQVRKLLPKLSDEEREQLKTEL